MDINYATRLKSRLGIDIRQLSAAGWRQMEDTLAAIRYGNTKVLAEVMDLPTNPAAWDAQFKRVTDQYRYNEMDVLMVPTWWAKKFGDTGVVNDFSNAQSNQCLISSVKLSKNAIS